MVTRDSSSRLSERRAGVALGRELGVGDVAKARTEQLPDRGWIFPECRGQYDVSSLDPASFEVLQRPSVAMGQEFDAGITGQLEGQTGRRE